MVVLIKNIFIDMFFTKFQLDDWFLDNIGIFFIQAEKSVFKIFSISSGFRFLYKQRISSSDGNTGATIFKYSSIGQISEQFSNFNVVSFFVDPFQKIIYKKINKK